MKKIKIQKYDGGGWANSNIPPEYQQFLDWGATQPETNTAQPEKKSNFNFGGGAGTTFNTMPLLQGANALVTNFIYNPMMRAEEAKMRRNLMTPVTAPSNFAGTDMPMYKDGGTVTHKKGNIVITEELTPTIPSGFKIKEDNELPPIRGPFGMEPFTPQPVQVPNFRPVAPPEPKTLEYETLHDLMGNKTLSPVFKGPWEQSEVRKYWDNIPSSIGGMPVNRGDAWKEAWQGFIPGSSTEDWMPTFAYGGQVNPILAEGGETMVLPGGSTKNIIGDKHSAPSGGELLGVPDGTRVYSDRIKVPKEIASGILGTTVNKKYTAAELSKKFNTSKEDKVINNPTSNPIAIRTAELMKDAKNSKLDQIFDYQESTKTTKSPVMARGGQVGRMASDLVSGVQDVVPDLFALNQAITDFPVFSAKYQPTFNSYVPTMNIDPALNANLGATKPLLDSNSGNASIDAARALQGLGALQDANNQLYGQKFNFDTQQKAANQQYNTQIANQANMINLQRTDAVWDKITQRQAVKEQSLQNIVNNAYQKSKAKEYENRSLDLINTANKNYAYNPASGGFAFVPDGNGNFVHVPLSYLNQQMFNSSDGVRSSKTITTDNKGNKKVRTSFKEDN